MSKTILITGANGNISSGIIQNLKGGENKLRALVRNPEKAEALKKLGVETFVGDLEKPWTLAPAFEGVNTVWMLTPGNPRAPEQCSSCLWAAKQGGASYIVRMSAVGAAHDAPTINSRLHALSDSELKASGIAYTILKPHWFNQNFMMAAGSVAKEGAMYFAMGEGKMGVIDSRDISDFAAKVLTTSGHEGKTYTLTGPESLSMHEVVKILGAQIGKTVNYIPVPVEGAREALLGMGLDAWTVNLFCEYFIAYSANWGNFVTEDFHKVMGVSPRSFATFAKDFAGVFGKT